MTELCEFLAASCPTKSGEKSVTYHQYVSDDALYQAYFTTSIAPVSFSTFYNIKRWMRIKHAGKYLGQFDCAKCLQLTKLNLKSNLTMEEGQEQQRCRRHEDAKKMQRLQYQRLRANLLPRHLLILMDFTSVFLTPKVGTSNDFSVVQDCIVVLEWIENSARKRLNLDYLCGCPESNKNDYFFVLHAWLKLFRDQKLNERFDALHIWTDGGPHHFKTRYCQWMWHWLSTNLFDSKLITHNFFASYHGHSLADAHAASIKRVLHSQYNTSQLQRLTPTTSALYWGPANASDFSALLSHACSLTQVYVFPHIDRDPTLKPQVSHVPGIKSKHCLIYASGTCAAANDSVDASAEPFFFSLKSSS